MNTLEEYNITATDWRRVLQRNQRNTRFVIFLFVFIYMSIGLLIDTYFNVSILPHAQSFIPRETYEQYYAYSGSHANYSYSYAPVSSAYPSASWEQIRSVFLNLITFKTLPIATLIMMGIAIFSLLVAHFFHRQLTMMGTKYREVTASESGLERQLYNVVEEMKIAASLKFIPKVYIIEANYMNAFASGLGESTALVAITRGLLEKLDRDELQAVMAHELSHIRHNDIRLTMTVAILSNLMLIAIDLVFRNIIYSRNQGKDNGLKIIIIIMRFALPILTLLLMMYLSRTRELMADSGCVELMRSNKPLARALLKIDADHKANVDDYKSAYNNTPHEEVRQASYLYDPGEAGIATIFSLNTLFSTHPSLATRLEALGISKRKETGE
jgi:heat shock protein HtpX